MQDTKYKIMCSAPDMAGTENLFCVLEIVQQVHWEYAFYLIEKYVSLWIIITSCVHNGMDTKNVWMFKRQ